MYIQYSSHPDLVFAQEVQVFSADEPNVDAALAGVATSSSSCYDGDASLTTNGVVDDDQPWPNSCHTGYGASEWLEIDLQREVPIAKVVIWNRADGFHKRLQNAQLELLNANRQPAGVFTLSSERQVVLASDLVIERTLYQSPEFAARPYQYDYDDTTQTGSPKNYCPPIMVSEQQLSVPITTPTTLVFIVNNVDRNMHLQGGSGEGCKFGLVITTDMEGQSNSSNPWVGQRIAEEPRVGGGGRGMGFWLGMHFPAAVEVAGIELTQGAAGGDECADIVELQMMDRGQWVTAHSFTLPEASYGKTSVKRIGIEPDVEEGGVLGMIADKHENWIGELLYHISVPVLQGAFNDHVIMLMPTTKASAGAISSSVLICDPCKPSFARWAVLVVEAVHHTANLYALREHGRRAYTQLVWTSDYQLCKREISPKSISAQYLSHPWTQNCAGWFCDDQPAEGGWSAGSNGTPSLVVRRRVGEEATLQTMIPSRFLVGILPDVLTTAFRFWKDECDGKLVAEKLKDADENWFPYELQLSTKNGCSSSAGAGNTTMQGKPPLMRQSSSAIRAVNEKLRKAKQFTEATKALQKLEEQRTQLMGGKGGDRDIIGAVQVIRLEPVA
jgi:hypothetical protein